ncbi:MAG TPA: asparagine synthase (glutamine-hydrolyzing) [Gammaproteobacteria bacterium]|nr:asparagine synthase (glutamine-hydrolyzing) [Gammaproteobacteria bacterium]
MCGIAGIVGRGAGDVALEELRAMAQVLRHRGPDEEGFYLGDTAGLAIRRLRVIDLATGRQPMRSEDGAIAIVLNGEIYNYLELRRELEHRGHRFRSRSDTETVLRAYEAWGLDCVRKLRGMFAFALWDERRKTLHIARDRLGIKPLYYGEIAGRFVFASELKAILQLPALRRSLNPDALDHLLATLTTPATESIVAGVHKLEPAHTLSLAPGRAPEIRRYWSVEFEPDRTHDAAYFADGLRELLAESVRLHCLSDVPLGAFLSGGVDSSAIVALMARTSAKPVKTFSIGFENGAFDERDHARRVAQEFGTEHHELVLDADIEPLLERLAWHLDEPFGDSSAIPTYAVSELAAREVTVVLSGDGGDELFAGYDKYGVEERERRRERLPALLRRGLGRVGSALPEGARGRNFLRHLGLSGMERYLDAGALFDRAQRDFLVLPEARARNRGDEQTLERGLDGSRLHWLSRLQQLDLGEYLPLDILTKVDRMSMAHSLEARVPLLDHKLVEFAATIPPELQRRNGESKHIFKTAMRGILPEATITRRKQGFAVPLGTWFRGRLTSMLHELLLGETASARGIFDRRYVERLIAMHERGRGLDLELWTLMSFELWCRIVFDRAPPAMARDAAAPQLVPSPPAEGLRARA